MPTARLKDNRFRREAQPRRRTAAAGVVELQDEEPSQLVRLVRAGLPFHRLARFQKTAGLPWEETARWIGIPLRTLTRRHHQGRLRWDESDRLVRAARLFAKAVDLFEGDAEAARRWLRAPQSALGGEPPLELASTDIGSRQVEDLITQLEHGVFP